MNIEKRISKWFGNLMDERPISATCLMIGTPIIIIGIIAVIVTLTTGDDGKQKQIEFTNACNAMGKVATLHYEEVYSGKNKYWKPVIECK